MTADIQTLSLEIDSGTKLAVEFRWEGDRFRHDLYLTGDDRKLLAASVEGDPSEAWPVSPALQQLNIQTLPDGNQAALLVGMAGKSHFSLSVTADKARQCLIFEPACRYQEVPRFIGSTYAWPAAEALAVEFNDAQPTMRTERGAEAIFQPSTADWPPPALARWWYALTLASDPAKGPT